MSSSPKIMVFRLREIIYTLILAFLVIFLVVCLILMFAGKTGSRTDTEISAQTQGERESTDESGTEDTDSLGAAYIAGVYTSSITLGSASADVQVTVSSDRIKAIELVNLSETAAVSYPLVSSSLENLAEQILEKQKLEGITCAATSRYTSQLLLNAISSALAKAAGTDK
ncbi:MAG: hypothetical protein LUF35_06995 [Lachnospiraceae bacterium]|nr:hypothetical protein [Lachnospiraceae bacterium]